MSEITEKFTTFLKLYEITKTKPDLSPVDNKQKNERN